MRVTIVGGGPGGLYLALLLRRRGLADRVRVVERNPPDATFGYGIVFSGRTLRNLAAADPDSYAAIDAASRRWAHVLVVHKGETVRIGGNEFVGIGRLAFLGLLQDECRRAGVELEFDSPVTDPETLLADADLLVGADGVGSVVRQTWRTDFQPTVDERRNLYVWLGTPAVFEGLTMIFKSVPGGALIAHAYEYGPEGSTFVVEASPEALAATGLDRLPPEEALASLATTFEAELGGAPLAAKGFRWLRFVMLSCANWYRQGVVLLGDAVHTAHFSIGSGTKLALEDAVALADAIGRAPGGRTHLEGALAAYVERRKPEVEALQAASRQSLEWLEDLGDDLELAPVALAYRMMTRSGRVDDESLRRRDPDFAAAVLRLHVS